jgi:hypothetical protein
MIGSRVAASLFATVCMYVTAGLVDVLAIPKTHVSLSGRLPLWYASLVNVQKDLLPKQSEQAHSLKDHDFHSPNWST